MSDDPYERIGIVLDRFQEAHFWIHMLEQYYHSADLFRWHLNVFIKAIHEVPLLVNMALQNEKGFTAWYKPYRIDLANDPLFKISRRRDFIVHRGMLQLNSHGTIGITEGRGIKLGIGTPIGPLEDSDVAMERYLRVISAQGDFFEILKEDEDSVPCVYREWRLPELEDEIVNACAAAWLRTGETIAEVLRWLSAKPQPLSLDCRHTGHRVQFKLYERDKLKIRLAELRKADT